jgi:O-antigen/teichoic acid export membrane protein
MLTIVAGSGTAQILTVLVAPLLTRLYAPAEFGTFAVAASVLATATSVACLKYDSAIPLPRSDVEAASVVGLCLLSSVLIGIVTGLGVWLLAPTVLDQDGASELRSVVVLIAIGVVGGGVVYTFRGWAIRTKAYGELARNHLTQSGTLVITQTGLGLLGWGAPGLLVGAVASGIAGSTRLAVVAWRSHGDALRRMTVAGIREAAGRYRLFAILSTPSTFINTLGLHAPVLLIVAFYGPIVGGQLALAQRVIGLPATVFAGAIGQAFTAEAARHVRESPLELRGLFIRTTRSNALLVIGPILVAAVAAPLAFGIIFGEEWRVAGLYVVILAPMYFLQFVSAPTGAALGVLERQDLHLVREVARLLLMSGAIVVAAYLNLSSTLAIVTLSAAGCLTYAIYGALTWHAVRLHHGRALEAAKQVGVESMPLGS